MADTETRWNPATKRYEGGFQKADEGAVAGSTAGAAARDASKIGAKKTGRGMLPGETTEQWRSRLAKMDSESPQKEAFKDMLDTKKTEGAEKPKE